MKIKTNKTNKKNIGKRNNTRKTTNTRKTNNKGKTYRISRKSNKLIGGQMGALIPLLEGQRIVNRLQYLATMQYLVTSSSRREPLCEEVQELIPAFQNTPDAPVNLPEPVAIMGNGSKQYIIGTESYFIKTAEEATILINKLQSESAAIWEERSRITCATLLLLGIISSKLQRTGYPFIIVAKGGLGVALVSSQLPGDTESVSVGDLDFKVVKNPKVASGKYHPGAGLYLSLHICYFIQWVLEQIVGEGYSISVLDPTTRKKVCGYQDMVKISLRAPNKMLFPFLDMDFGGYEKNKHYFENMSEISSSVPIGGGAQMPVSFIFQNRERMLTEKLYYYAQYLFLKEQLAGANYINFIKLNPSTNTILPTGATSPSVCSNFFPFGKVAYEAPSQKFPDGVIMFNGEPITIEDCLRFLNKFKRSINLLTDAIIEADKTIDKTNLSVTRRNIARDLILQIPNLGLSKFAPLRLKLLDNLYPETARV